MPQPSMTRYTSHLETTGKLRTIGVSLPLVRAIADDPAYQPREDAKPRIRHRNPSLRSLVKLAMQCDSAEQLGEAIKRRYQCRNSADFIGLLGIANCPDAPSGLHPLLHHPRDRGAQLRHACALAR
jgi:hypothetical protein